MYNHLTCLKNEPFVILGTFCQDDLFDRRFFADSSRHKDMNVQQVQITLAQFNSHGNAFDLRVKVVSQCFMKYDTGPQTMGTTKAESRSYHTFAACLIPLKKCNFMIPAKPKVRNIEV